jgi:hypothetical protein
MKRSIIKSLVLAVLVLVFAIAFVSPSEAEKKIKPIVLEGTYGVTGQDVCVGHWTTPPLGESGSTYWTKTSVLQGTATFKADGTGTATVDQVTIVHPIYTPIPLGPYYLRGSWPAYDVPLGSVSTSNVTSSFTYTIDPLTRSIRRTVTDGSGTFSSGTSAGISLTGKTFEITPFDTAGYVSLDTQTIIGSSPVFDASAGLESQTTTVTIYKTLEEGGGIFSVTQEICHRTRNSVLIK